ncbi:MAG: DUF2283 domain-containing protein [Bacteroidia bacterium]|nr:DUF2283 domain-containing protein [Bacteroidia bacterium]
MKISYDPEADAINITFREGKVNRTIEIAPEINLDLDLKNRPLYLEIIGASEKLGKTNTKEITLINFAHKKQYSQA